MVTIKTGRGLVRISARLGRIPSFAFAGLFLLLIPCFALLYTFMAADFFHSTAQYEKSLDGEAKQILEGIGSSVRDSFRRVHGSDFARKNGWELDLRDIGFLDLQVEGDSISFLFAVGLLAANPDSLRGIVGRRVTIPVRSTYVRFDSVRNNSIAFRKINPQPHFVGVIAGYSEPPLGEFFRDPRVPGDTLWLVTSADLHQKIVNYATAVRGFPSQVTGRFGRMFYLSTATITTLGYGDIVPLTARSRFAVSLEAILGIVVIGLFLNSLARESAAGEGN